MPRLSLMSHPIHPILQAIPAASLIGLCSYLGGELVYRHGVRVGEDEDGIPGAS